jgi:elongation factor P
MNADEIRVGNVLKIDGKICKVLSQEMRGTGKFGKTVHVRLKSLEDGNLIEKGIRSEDKVEAIDVHSVKMQYSYQEGDNLVFMNMESFEQYPVSSKAVGPQKAFLKEGAEINVMFAGEKALSIDFPKIAELKVTSAPPPVKSGGDSNYKEVELENGIKVLAPQFVKEGDKVRIDIENLSYMDRVTLKSFKEENQK